MAESKKKAKYFTKTVKFGEKQFTLYSLDGLTWSSRRDELHQILERQEQERKSFNQLLGDQGADKAKPAAADEAADDGEDERLLEAEADEILPIDTAARGKIKPRPVVTAKAAAAKSSAESKRAVSTPAPKKKAGKSKPQKVIAAPKARASSKPVKKAAKGKGKKKVA